MKIITWNVNGIRACMGKGMLEYFDSERADIICLQETKMQPGQAEVPTPGYEQYWNSAEKKGYSGTAVPEFKGKIIQGEDINEEPFITKEIN